MKLDIAKEFQELLNQSHLRTASKAHRWELQRAFYLGVASLLVRLEEITRPGVSDDDAAHFLADVNTQINTYVQQCKDGVR